MKNKGNRRLRPDRELLNWLLQMVQGRKRQIVVLLFVQGFLGAYAVMFAMLLRGMIDSAVAGSRQGFLTNAAVLGGLIVTNIALQALEYFLRESAKSSLENRLKKRLFSVLLSKDYASVTAVHSGEWMNRLTSDTVVTANGLVQILPGCVGVLIQLTAALAAIFYLEPRFGYLLIPGGLVIILIATVFRKRMKGMHKQIQEKDGRLRMFLQEHLGSLLIVRSFAMEEQIVAGAEKRMKAHRAARMKRNHFSNVCNVGFYAIMRGIYLLAAVYCSYGILSGAVTYGTLTAILQLITHVQSPFANITSYLPQYYAMLASAERLMEAEHFEDDCPDGMLGMEEVQRYYEQDFDTLHVEDASFTYLPFVEDMDLSADLSGRKEGQPVVISHMNLKIKKGDYVAFTGYSGCGKSTLLKLVMCLFPLDEGRRYLKDVRGAQTELSSSWHKLFAYVPQGNQLMSGTIREIIAFSDRKKMKDEARMRQAIEIACADGFIDALEHGLDTVLGERGQGLSEGQMQRIAIARAIFSDNPILILDEATSALDDETEKQVLENLHRLTNRTVLIVTHRPAALEICDRQVVMTEDGVEIRDR